MYLKEVLLGIGGLSFGLLSSAGVFTVLATVGLVPRFAGKMHVAKHVLLLESAVVWGTLTGGFFSVFAKYGRVGDFVREMALFGEHTQAIWSVLGNLYLMIYGLFAGMFVGCLAFAIAEMLDSIPIFSRRIGFRHGLGIAVLAAALGKVMGSLIYFSKAFFLPSM